MAKLPLTSEAVRKKQEEMFRLDDRELEREVFEIAKDMRKYVFDNFELIDEQKRLYESFSQGYNLCYGWQSCSLMVLRQFVDFSTTLDSKQTRQAGGGATITGSIDASYDEKNGGKISAKLKISC